MQLSVLINQGVLISEVSFKRGPTVHNYPHCKNESVVLTTELLP